mgnify:CR=1 FL=1
MRPAKNQLTKDPVVLRIIETLKEKGIPEREFVKAIGLSNGAFTKWKYHDSKGYMLHIEKMAEYLGVSSDYLLRNEANIEPQSLSNSEKKLLELYRQMDDAMKEKVIETSKLLVELTEFRQQNVS